MNLIKSKTLAFALLLAVLGVLEASFGTLRGLLIPIMGDAAFGIFTIAVSVGVAVLRVLTTVPLSEK